MEHLIIVGISFHSAGKIFDFSTQDLDLAPGDKVIVETERGRALGSVVRKPHEISADNAPPKLKSILRRATENDLQMARSNSLREQEALQFCQLRVKQRKMEMKLVRAEYLFDGSKIIFYFTADGRVDFRELVRDLAQHFRTRIEMRQIGVRDEAKQVGGLGICGRELCCSSHLREFAPVSVKMAKTQGLALNPTKISGQCGRLLCCLAYEYETYTQMQKTLPKYGKKLQLKSGMAEVISRDVLGQKVTLSCHNGERCQMHIDELNKEISNSDSTTATSSAEQKTAPKKQRQERSGDSRQKSGKPNQRTNKKDRREKTAPEQEQQKKTDSTASPEKSQRRRRRPRRRSNRRPKSPENQS